MTLVSIFKPPAGVMLYGPWAQREFPAFKIEIYTTSRDSKHFDPAIHPKKAYRAASEWMDRAKAGETLPNPALVPLDEGEHEDGAKVYARVNFKDYPIARMQ